ASLSSKHKPVKPGRRNSSGKMWILVDKSRPPRAFLYPLPWIALSRSAGTYPRRPRRLARDLAVLLGQHALPSSFSRPSCLLPHGEPEPAGDDGVFGAAAQALKTCPPNGRPDIALQRTRPIRTGAGFQFGHNALSGRWTKGHLRDQPRANANKSWQEPSVLSAGTLRALGRGLAWRRPCWRCFHAYEGEAHSQP